MKLQTRIGRRTALGRANGAHSYYAYGDLPWLLAMTHDLAGDASDLSTEYHYNPAGQVVEKDASKDVYAFRQGYEVRRSYAANALNQYTRSGNVTLGYDGRGNLAHAPAPNTGGNGDTNGQTDYSYTADNLIAVASGPGGASHFNYDTLGRMSMDQSAQRLSWAWHRSPAQGRVTTD